MIVALKAGATKVELVALNAVLAEYHCHYRFKLGKNQRDPKATGNECRKILWTPGLVLDLIDARWGKATTSADRAAAREVGAAQASGAHLLQADDDEPPPPPPPPPPPAQLSAIQDTIGTRGLDFAALLALSTDPVDPTQPADPVPPTDAGIDDGEDEANEDEEAESASLQPQDDVVEEVVGDIVGTRATAITCFLTLLHLQLELNTPWPDSERNARAETGQKKGASWATALRAHSNNGVGHYYMHLSFAHLKELIKEHGHLQHGNDEVLEKGNRDMKRFRDMTFWGGGSSKAAQARPVMQTRYRLVRDARDGEEAQYEPYTVSRNRQQASWVECMRMQVAADLLAVRRPHQIELDRKSARRMATKHKRSEARDAVKAEAVGVLAKASKSVPDVSPTVTPTCAYDVSGRAIK